MLVIMRNLLLIMVLLLVPPVYAEVYRSVDEDGNPVFTDQPTEGAEKIELKEIQTIDRQPVKLEPAEGTGPTIEVDSTEESVPEELAGYTGLSITSPQDNESIRENAGNVTVSVAINPELNQSAGHQLVLIMDGTELMKSTSTTFNTSNLDRGTHNVSVAVIDRDGKEILRSNAVTFHLQRHSALHKNQPPPPAPNPQPGP